MKISKRFPPLLVAAATLVFVGCVKAEAPPVKVASHACGGPPTVVTVFVEYDGTTATTRNKTVYLCEKDTVEWVAADETAYVSDDIKWKNDESPFAEKPTHVNQGKRKVLHSKPPKPGTAKHGFDYEAWLVLQDGSKKPIDPRIEVMD